MEVEEDKSKDERFDTRQKTKRTTIVAFAVMGFLVDFFFAINISASQDILEGTEIPTSVVLLAASVPACLSTVLYPYVCQRISVLVASCAIVISSVTGILLTSLIQDPVGKLTGASLTSFLLWERRCCLLFTDFFPWKNGHEQLCFGLRNIISSSAFILHG